jgi:hypothetical protein
MERNKMYFSSSKKLRNYFIIKLSVECLIFVQMKVTFQAVSQNVVKM